MKNLALFVFASFAFYCGLGQAQILYPVSGGTRTEPDLEKKKCIILIAESDSHQLTLATAHKYKVAKNSGKWGKWCRAKIALFTDRRGA